jgi:hypothetical protein
MKDARPAKRVVDDIAEHLKKNPPLKTVKEISEESFWRRCGPEARYGSWEDHILQRRTDRELKPIR